MRALGSNRWVSHGKQVVYHLLVSLIITAPAWYNRYPLVYFDTGAYLQSSIDLEPSFHRAVGYPILLKWTGFGISNWPIVVLQGLLLSWLLWRLVNVFAPIHARRNHVFLVVATAMFSSMSWYASQLMPDVFTLIGLLAFALVLVDVEAGWRRLLSYALVTAFALITHLSNGPLHLLLLLVLVLAMVLSGKGLFRFLSLRQWLTLTLPLIAAFLFTMTYNAAHGKGFRYSLGTNVFLVANFGEMGILQLYLDENCPNPANPYCTLSGRLPRETDGYLWRPDAPVNQIEGGWEAMNEVSAPIVHDFMFKPKYLKWWLVASAKATIKQMFQIEIGSGLQYKYAEDSPPYWPMRDHFKMELNEYLVSVQNKGGALPLPFFRVLNYIGIGFSIVLWAMALTWHRRDERLNLLMVFTALSYFLHAATTGIMANVYERLQARVLPLILIVALLWLCAEWDRKRSKNLFYAENE